MWFWWFAGILFGLSGSLTAIVALAVACVVLSQRTDLSWQPGPSASALTLSCSFGLGFAPIIRPLPLGSELNLAIACSAVLTICVCWFALGTAGRRTAEVRGRFFVDAIAVRQWQAGATNAGADDLVISVERTSLGALENMIASLEGRVFYEQLRLAVAAVSLAALVGVLLWQGESASAALLILTGPGVLAACTHATAAARLLNTLTDPGNAARRELRLPRPVHWRTWLVMAVSGYPQPSWIRWFPCLQGTVTTPDAVFGRPPTASELPRVLASMPPQVMQAVALWPPSWRHPGVLARLLDRLAGEELPWWNLDIISTALAADAESHWPPHEIARTALLDSKGTTPIPEQLVELPPWMEALLVEDSRKSSTELSPRLLADVLQWLNSMTETASARTGTIVVAQAARGNLLRGLRRAGTSWAVIGRHDLSAGMGNPGCPSTLPAGKPADMRS